MRLQCTSIAGYNTASLARFLFTVRGVSGEFQTSRRTEEGPDRATSLLKIARAPALGNALMQREFLQSSSNLAQTE
jgi:hypothetical protein